MGVKDTVTAKYMQQNEIFADAFNYFIYNGEQVISPDSLEELDTREIEVPYGGTDGAEQPVQKTRDVIKSVIAMMDKKTAYLLLAIEAQSNIHYAMPVKNMVYDALQYAKQVEKAVSSHKRSDDYKGVGSDEYLSGFMKSDWLLPVVTLVVYFDSKTWDGPLSIHEMFENQDARVLALVSDYKINLIAPSAIEDNDFGKFQTTLKEVLSFIKYANNKKKLENVLEENQAFHHLGREEVDVLNACVGAKITMKKDEEAIDVCLAIQQMKEEAATKAAEKATRAAEEAAGKAAEEAAGKAADEATTRTLLSAMKNLMNNTGMSVEQAITVLGISEKEKGKLVSRL